MFGFKKKDAAEVEFEASIKNNFFQVDENRRLIRVKEGFKLGKPFAIDSIMDIEIKCDDTVVNKRNMGAAIAGGALLGIGGLLLAGTHNKEYISRLEVLIKTNGFNRPVIKIPFITSKMQKNSALTQAVVDSCEKLVQQLNILKGDN